VAQNISVRGWRIAVALVLFVALAVRIGWVIRLPADAVYLAQLPDQLEYFELGRNMLRGEGLKFFDADFRDTIFAYRTPGYPLFVAGLRANLRAIRIVQAVLDTLTVLGAYVLARRWLGAGTSTFAALLVAGNPFLIYFCGLILSETLFAFMLAWGMALVAISPTIEKRRWSIALWWIGAIVLVLSIHVRPSALLLPVLLGIVGAIANRDRPAPYHSKWLPPIGATVLLLTLLVLLPWAYRNWRVLGAWVWTTTNTGITLYDGFNPDATGASNQAHVRSWPQLRQVSELERSKYLSDLAWQYIREHPREVGILTVVKIARTWSPVPLSDQYGSRRNVAIAMLYNVPFFVLILAGLWFGRPSTSAKVFLLLPAIYFTAVHALSVGSLRYRLPADVPMAVLAASSVALIERQKREAPAVAAPADSEELQ
jgi:4-amino-4-deoxy-L-arabinose transferase-like glycosyltransferase